jgi:hypothetical protein
MHSTLYTTNYKYADSIHAIIAYYTLYNTLHAADSRHIITAYYTLYNILHSADSIDVITA